MRLKKTQQNFFDKFSLNEHVQNSITKIKLVVNEVNNESKLAIEKFINLKELEIQSIYTIVEPEYYNLPFLQNIVIHRS